MLSIMTRILHSSTAATLLPNETIVSSKTFPVKTKRENAETTEAYARNSHSQEAPTSAPEVRSLTSVTATDDICVGGGGGEGKHAYWGDLSGDGRIGGFDKVDDIGGCSGDGCLGGDISIGGRGDIDDREVSCCEREVPSDSTYGGSNDGSSGGIGCCNKEGGCCGEGYQAGRGSSGCGVVSRFGNNGRDGRHEAGQRGKSLSEGEDVQIAEEAAASAGADAAGSAELAAFSAAMSNVAALANAAAASAVAAAFAAARMNADVASEDETSLETPTIAVTVAVIVSAPAGQPAAAAASHAAMIGMQ